ncbi:MAG: MOSC domain-containing protein [Bryobacteraceae bacterium]
MTQSLLGSVVSLWRYPVKSMLGEELNAADLTIGGLVADRTYALIDRADGKVATAKNPRKWPQLFDFRAALVDSLSDVPQTGSPPPRLRITLPDGTVINSDQPDLNQILSSVLKRAVTLNSTSSDSRNATAEGYWPDMEGLSHRDTVTDFGLPEGTFFDAAVVHLLTTSTLNRLHALYPQGRFESRRFRPNMVVGTPDGESGFVEDAWIGKTLAIGNAVRLTITAPCFRCVMTTLAQGDLPKDAGILRTAAQHHQASVGVYASVLQSGKVRRGDPVKLV